MSGFQFISCLRFSLQLLVAESAFFLLFPRREHFALRAVASLAGLFPALYLLYRIVSSIPGQNIVVYTTYYLLVLILTVIAIAICFDTTRRELLFIGIGGYALQHMAYGTTRLMQYFVHPDTQTPFGYFMVHICFFLILPPLWHFFFIRRQFDRENLQKRDLRLVGIAAVTLSINITLSQALRLEPAGMSSEFVRLFVCSVYVILCCGMELFLLFYIPYESRMRTENELMEKMIHTMDARLKLSRKGIDIINRRCHELKIQLASIKEQNADLMQSETVSEMEESLSAYENSYQTGSIALDYILNERSPLMEEEHVQFSCMADGAQLAFMRQSDISTLFGNALDNALECVLKEPEEQRFIDLRITRQGQMLHIHLTNTCTEAVVFRDELPVGPQEEEHRYGFGVRSIAHIIEKYEGFYAFRQQNNTFILDAACPIT